MNYLKTALLFVAMFALLIFVGGVAGGEKGMLIAFGVALLLNFFTYWFSDKIILKMYGAKPVTASDYPVYCHIVRELSGRMELPMPKLYVINMGVPNAFATGRDPAHSAVAVSPELLEALDKQELEGVLAHELSHVKHRDTLVMMIAVAMATAITLLAEFARIAAFFTGGRDDDGPNPVTIIVLYLLALIAAPLIQLAVSRTREYMADENSARVTNRPQSLISALEKLSAWSKEAPITGGVPATASLFIVNPFKENFFVNLLSTHPSLSRRKINLEKVGRELGVL